jgi:hypothetical protein
MPRKKLTPKERGFVNSYTDIDSKETFGNGVQSVMKNYNVKNENTAGVIAHELLRNPKVLSVVQGRILKKEELQDKLGSLVEKLERSIGDEITAENIPIVNQLGINIERNAKLNGDLIEKTLNLNVNVDRSKELTALSVEELQSEIMKRMQEGYRHTEQ